MRTALAVLTVGAVSFGFFSFERKIGSFSGGGVHLRVAEGSLEVTAIDPGRFRAAPEIETGDRIVLANGEPVTAPAAFEAAMRARPEGSTLVVVRGSQPLSVAYLPPFAAIDWRYLFLAAIGLLYLAVGTITLFKERGAASRVFFALALASFVIYVYSPAGPADALFKILYGIEELARLALGPLLVHFFLVFPRRAAWARPAAFVAIYAPSLLLAGISAHLLSRNGASAAALAAGFAALDRAELLLLAVAFVAAIALVARSYGTSAIAVRKQIKWIYVGVTLGFLPFVVLYVLPYVLEVPSAVLRNMAVLPLALIPLAFAYSILKYQLWNIEVIFKEVLSYSLTVIAGLVGFSTLNLILTHTVSTFLPASKHFISFTTGLMLASTLVPMKRRIGTFIDRLQYRETFRQRRAVEDFSRELARFESVDALLSRLFERLEDALRLERMNIFFREAEGDEAGGNLRPYRVDGERAPLRFRLGATEVERLLGQENALRLDPTGLTLPPGSPVVELYRAGYRYLFPIRVKDALLAVFVASFKEEGVPLNRDDLDLVASVMAQVALALENAKLYNQLTERLAEVVRLKEYSESIIESSAAGIAVVRRDGELVSANHAFCALAGRSREALSGVALEELLPVLWQDLLTSPAEREISLATAGGTRNLTLAVSPIGGGSENETALLHVVLVTDITRRVELERELKDKERLASLGMLAAGVAHEVNTPITGISSYAQMLLADTPSDDPRYAILKKMEKQSFRAATIVNNLLDFARDRRFDTKRLDLTAAVAESVLLTAEMMAERQVSVEQELPATALPVYGNEGQLQQVFINILLNARDACARGGHIRVALTGDDHRAVVTFTDDGRGMSEEERGHIFEPFFSTKTNRGGTGLGLTLSYDIVHQHGGDILVVSQPGAGSTFTVVLPQP